MKTIIKIKTQQCCILNNPIQRELSLVPGVFGVSADMFNGIISIDHTNETDKNILNKTVIECGYELIEDIFDKKANEWDSVKKIESVQLFVNEIKKHVKFKSSDKIVDFGCGTGLVGLDLLQEVSKAIMVDTSTSMLEVLESKLSYAQMEKIEIINGPLTLYNNKDIDKLVSFMAFHHIENINDTIETIGKTIRKEGMLIIGDLVEEDGSFHAPEIVPHNGFNLQTLSNLIENNGFRVVEKYPYNTQKKEDKEYQRFILIAINNN